MIAWPLDDQTLGMRIRMRRERVDSMINCTATHIASKYLHVAVDLVLAFLDRVEPGHTALALTQGRDRTTEKVRGFTCTRNRPFSQPCGMGRRKKRGIHVTFISSLVSPLHLLSSFSFLPSQRCFQFRRHKRSQLFRTMFFAVFRC